MPAFVAPLVSGLLGAAGAGSANKSAKRAERRADEIAAAEIDRDRRAADTSRAVDQLYDSPARQGQYQDYLSALRGEYGQQLGRAKRDQSRKLKFALARSGNVGGSLDVDTNKRLGQEFSDASLSAERSAQGGVDRLRAADDASRMQLISLIQAGLNPVKAISRGQQGLATNLTAARSNIAPIALGDMFQNTAATYKGINERAERRRGFGYNLDRQNIWGGP